MNISSHLRRRPLAIGVVALVGLMATLGIMAVLVNFHRELHESALAWLDYWLPGWLHAHSSPGETTVMRDLTTIGSPLELISLVALALVLLLLKKHWGEAIGVALSEVGAVVLNQASKALFHRDRPIWTWALSHERNFSFPSGHAMLGLITFGTLAYLACRMARSTAARVLVIVLTTLLVLGIGLSRVYLGVHWPSDIIAGFIAGGIWLATVVVTTEVLHRLLPRVRPPSGQEPEASARGATFSAAGGHAGKSA